MDWSKLLNRTALDRERFARLATIRTQATIDTPRGKLRLEPQHTPSPSAPVAIFAGAGLRVLARPEERCNDRTPYGLEIDFQGAFLSSDDTGLDAIRATLAPLERWLLQGRAPTAPWQPGRQDLAVDIAIAGADRSRWIEEKFFHRGNYTTTAHDFASRAREHTQQGTARSYLYRDDARALGGPASGRTFYLGRNPLLRCYERDKHTAGDWNVVRETLARLGWNPDTERLLRVEWEIKRDWITDQNFSAPGFTGGIKGTDLTAAHWFASLPSTWRQMFARTRHVDHRSEDKRSRQPTSPLWKAALLGVDHFEKAGANWYPSVARWIQRESTLAEMQDRAADLLAQIAAVHEMPFSELAELLAHHAGRRIEEHRPLQRKVARMRHRYADDTPDTATA